MSELEKVKRKNLLSQLFDEIFQAKIKKYTPTPVMEFAGQHFNQVRQAKNKIMRERKITGKQYRRLIKNQRILSKAEVK